MKMLAVQTTCRYPTVVLHRKLGCLSKLQQCKRTKYWHKQYVSDSGPLEGAGEADANTEVNENSEDTGFQNSGKNDPHTHTKLEIRCLPSRFGTMHLQHKKKLKTKRRDEPPVTQCASQNSRPRILSDTKIRTLTEGQFLGQEQKKHYLYR